MLRERFAIDESRWEIRRGSVLDAAFMESLGRFSYVHSWGVLHHTGSMWTAVENVVRQNTAPGGLFHLALYNQAPHVPALAGDQAVVQSSPRVAFPLIKWAYISALFTKMSLRLRSPVNYVRQYNSQRGMDFFRDVDDWVGGLPYEFCTSGRGGGFSRGPRICASTNPNDRFVRMQRISIQTRAGRWVKPPSDSHFGK